MTTPLPFWRTLRVEGLFTVVAVDIEPGRTAELPIRTTLLGTATGNAMIRAIIVRHNETRDQLREGP